MEHHSQGPSGVEVRRCTADDAAALASYGIGTSVYVAGALERHGRGEVDFLVVLYAGVVAGSAELTFDDPPELKNLSVETEFRGRGLGSALITYAETLIELRHPGARVGERALLVGVGLDNPEAARLYERLGFVRTGRICTTTYEYADELGVSRAATERDEDLIKRW